MLAPNLKDGAGGLRDIQAAGLGRLGARRPGRPPTRAGDGRGDGGTAALVAQGYLRDDDLVRLALHRDLLLDARVALHRSPAVGRTSSRCRSRTRSPRCSALPDADALVRELGAAARSVVWITADMWQRLQSTERGTPRSGLRRADDRRARRAARRAHRARRATPSSTPTPCSRSRRATAELRRADRPRLARADRAAARRSSGRRERATTFIALLAVGPRHGRGVRDARPRRRARAAAPRVGARAGASATQRVPPLHRRPALARSGGRVRGAARPVDTARARASTATSRAARRATCSCSPRCSTTSARARRATTRWSASRSRGRSRRASGSTTRRPTGWRGSSATTCCSPTPRPAATSPTSTRSPASARASATCRALDAAVRAHPRRLARDRPVGVEREQGVARPRAVPRRRRPAGSSTAPLEHDRTTPTRAARAHRRAVRGTVRAAARRVVPTRRRRPAARSSWSRPTATGLLATRRRRARAARLRHRRRGGRDRRPDGMAVERFHGRDRFGRLGGRRPRRRQRHLDGRARRRRGVRRGSCASARAGTGIRVHRAGRARRARRRRPRRVGDGDRGRGARPRRRRAARARGRGVRRASTST